MELMEAVWTPAVARVREEVADMQAGRRQARARSIKIEPWDYRYYAEKVRKARYDLDQNEVKPYLQLEKLREGMFWVAGELFGFAFTPGDQRARVPPRRARLGGEGQGQRQHVGLWYFDPYARPGKRSGAWMNAYRSQERFDGEVTTIVSNNSNFVKGAAGRAGAHLAGTTPRRCSTSSATPCTACRSNVTYPSLSGTAWRATTWSSPRSCSSTGCRTPQVLQRFALHYQTGKPIPQALVDRIEKAATFNQGFATVEYLASALIDMKLHLAGDADIDPRRVRARDAGGARHADARS